MIKQHKGEIMAGGRPTKYKPEYCQMLIDHMAKGNSFWSFGADVDASFESLSNWTQQFPEFLEAKRIGMAKLLKFDEQLNLAGSSGQLKRVAKTVVEYDEDGNKKEVTYHDAATFGQSYRIFLMKNRYPKLYRDKIEIEDPSSGKKVGKTLMELMSDPELREAAKKIATKMSKPSDEGT